MRWIFHLFMGALSSFMILGLGRAPSAPSADLQELEAVLQAPEAQQIREIPNAARYHQEARQYRRAAEDARQDRRETRSQEYAALGLIRYQTALAVARQFEAAGRLQEMNAEIEELNPEVLEVSQSRNELAREIRELEDEIAAAIRERGDDRRRSDAQARELRVDQQQRVSDELSSEVLSRINRGIAEAEELRERGLEVNADEYDRTQGVFQRAQEQLDNARQLLDSQSGAGSTIDRHVEFAVQLFGEARDLAEPIHAETVEKMKPENRISTLRDLARNNFGAPFTDEEYQGVRVIMARLFEPGEGTFRRNTETMLDVLQELAVEYEEFSIQIYGFTRRGGGATENLTTSQLRAHNIREILVDAGVPESRIEIEGLGQDQIRFEDNPDNNDRVEVVFRHSNP